MPYTQNQLRALSGMGIVPWIKRASLQPSELLAQTNIEPAVRAVVEAAVQPIQQPTTQAETPPVIEVPTALQTPKVVDFMQTPLVEIPFRGQRCSQLGKADAPLLILVEAISQQQKQYPFEATDAKLFDDMLRAIAWRRQDVCLAVIPPANQADLVAQASGPCVADVCKPHRDAVLLFRHTLPETLDADELLVPMERASMPAWQLPHPALLRESPIRKRQAWNVLKAARARLS